MNYDQWTGILRMLVPTVLAFASGKGWIPNEAVGDIGTAVVGIGAAVWTIMNNKSGKVVPSTASGK